MLLALDGRHVAHFYKKNGEPEPEVGAPKLSAITIHHSETREQVQRVWAEGSCRGG